MTLTLARHSAAPSLADPFMPTVASVNLLPATILELLRLRVLRLRLLAAGLTVLVALAVVYLAQTTQIAGATARLDAEQARGAAVAREKTALAPVNALYAQVALTQQQIMQTMTKEVLFSDVTTRLTAAAADDVTLTTMSLLAVTTDVTDPNAVPVACPGSDPFSDVAVVGCITVAGTASARAPVGDFVDRLLADDHFAAPLVSTTVLDEETGLVAFTGTISLTELVYSRRYDDVQFLGEGPA